MDNLAIERLGIGGTAFIERNNTMRLYAPITKIDAEQRMVWGYASTATRDDQGEIIQREAIAAALPEYMLLGNIREMHQLSAVGKAKEAQMDENGLFLGAKVVDPLAWEKVKEGVYSGFSIGGRVTKRDSADPKTITGLVLSEISLVDRPANPDALFDVWKATGGDNQSKGTDMEGLATIGDLAGDKLAAITTAPAPHTADGVRQRWLATDGSEHLNKAAAIGRNAEIAVLAAEAEERAEARAAAKAEAETPADDPAEKAEVTGPNRTQPDLTAETADAADDADDKNPPDSGPAEKAAAVDGEPAPEAEAAPEPLTPAEIEKRAQEGADAEQALIDAALAAIERGDAALAGNEQVEKASDGAVSGTVTETSEGNVQAAETNQTVSGDEAEKAAHPVENTQEQAADRDPGNIPVGETGPDVSQVSQPVPTVSPPVPTLPAPGVIKSMYDLGDIADQALWWDGLAARLMLEAVMEGDGSPASAEAGRIRDTICGFLQRITTEETGELIAGTEMDDDGFYFMSARVENLQKADIGGLAPLTAKFALAVEKAGAKHGARDQMLLDKAYECAMQAAALDGCTKSAQNSLGAAADRLVEAGARSLAASTEKAAGSELAQISIIAKGGNHQALMDIGHFCLASMTNAAVCGTAAKANARHSAETMGQLVEAHDHLCAAGASCDMRQESVAMAAKTAGLPAAPDLLVKMTGTLDGLTKALTELRIEHAAMALRVEEIAQQPTPPLTQKMNVPVAKAQDGRFGNGNGQIDPDALAEFAKLSKDEQTLELIKMSRGRPMTLVPGPMPRNPERPTQ